MKDALGEFLVREGLITKAQLDKALDQQRLKGGRIGTNLVQLRYLSEETLTEFLGKQFHVPAMNLSKMQIDPQCTKLISGDIARRYHAIPISMNGKRLTVAMADPNNIFAIDGIKFVTGYEVEPVVCAESAMLEAIQKYYQEKDPLADILKDIDDLEMELVEEQKEEEVGINQLRVQVEEAPVVRLINGLFTDAVKRDASDIHIEPYENNLRVRYRIDGTLRDMMYPPLRMKSALISRVKILADMDIAERRQPQDGRIKIKMGKSVIDVRVSTIPSLFGEKIVMRILNRQSINLELSKLGFEEKALSDFLGAIKRPYGIVLVTGPTGSGKTTTLYTAITLLNTQEVNILTVEDPVEYNLEGINQVQVHAEIGLDFAKVLRAFLRQDPNIIMIGEIRDQETASIAIKAALTGHLVLSTVHTNDAPSAVVRLVDMGIEPFLVGSALNLIVAQRLVRKICPHCKIPANYPRDVIIDAGLTEAEIGGLSFSKGKGCAECNDTGYKGRDGIFEVMPITPKIREMIIERASIAEMKDEAVREGMLTLRESGLIKLKAGVSTLEEVLKETSLT
jgi:type IV pilus assembly protein PilB